ncbi:ferritin-like domain-containing protein [Hydrogenimonas sp. SS33]|uniref:ferritin-like domain-containing protein n=1 Tax=Hydrogenimonas leucolamina TaxID=2954236 RepID=UPI00336C1EF3
MYTNLRHGVFTFDHDTPVETFDTPSYASVAPIVRPREVPKRKRFDDPEGQGVLLHAIAHIEYSAIDLALDSAYRFRRMPEAYYADWVEVAHDEVRHFRMLEALMRKIGVRYGDYPVHTALFDAGRKSGGDPLERMAVVPRYLEANGLDANPKIIEKLRRYPPTPMLEAIVEALEVILEEEVSHVSKGDRWFKHFCEARGVDTAVYFDIVERYYPGLEQKNLRLNVDARRAAGFACDELKRMGAKKCE